MRTHMTGSEPVGSACSQLRSWVAVWLSAVALATVFVACGGGPSRSASRTSPSSSTTAPPAALVDVEPMPGDFVNINTMTRVGDHFVGSLNGHLAAALAVANSPTGGVYPVGTVIQLVPMEAMVKRYKGYSPATKDWEFFTLSATAQGTRILKRGTTAINNVVGTCASCHEGAASQFDFVCTKSHGCAGLPLDDKTLRSLQEGDPRPKK